MPNAPDDLDFAQTLRSGEQPILIGRYRIVRELGHGGMGSVYLAEDTHLDDRRVAIKTLSAILAHNKKAVADLKREAVTAMQLSHSAIVTLRAFEQSPEGVFLVLDYIEGETLEDHLADKGTLTAQETTDLLKPIAEALDYAHEKKVIHRDLKPANILIDKQGKAYLTDFGIAREMKDTLTRVTGRQDTSGTLPYMSPEQVNGENPTPAQDIYSFGAMLYECLAGHPPFYRGQIEHQILNKPADTEPLDSVADGMLCRTVLNCLDKVTEARPSTVAAVFVAQPVQKSSPPVPIAPIQPVTTLAPDNDASKAKRCRRSTNLGDAGATCSCTIVKCPFLLDDAKQGDTGAMCNLGWMYEHGQGVKTDCVTAVHWYRKGAEAGGMLAMRGLGWMYKKGWGVKKNELEAMRWYRKSADGGDTGAMNNIGLMYEQGRGGVSQDSVKAVRWYRSGAEAGDARAMINLAWNHSEGRGVKQNDEEAVFWYRKAIKSGCVTAMLRLGFMYGYGLGVASNDVEAVRWFREAAEAGNTIAMCNLGLMYESGRGVTKDIAEGMRWYSKSTAAGGGMAKIYIRDSISRRRSDTQAAAKVEEGLGLGIGIGYTNDRGVTKDDLETMYGIRNGIGTKNPRA